MSVVNRSVRRVPAGWQHPQNERGAFIPLLAGDAAAEAAEWDQENAAWMSGTRADECSFEEWNGPRPDATRYMPSGPHFQAYEECSEGTPISPVFPSPEELARWLEKHGARGVSGTYAQWLRLCREAK